MPFSSYSKDEIDEHLQRYDLEIASLNETIASLSVKPLKVMVFPIKATADTLIETLDYVANFRQVILNKFTQPQRLLNIHTITNMVDIPASELDYICYDNEPDNGALSTPAAEIAEPAKYTNVATSTIKSMGCKTAIAPSRSILLQEYKGVRFSKVDLLVMQLQRVVGSPDFESIAKAVSTHARKQNPDIEIFAQVNPALNSDDEIKAAIESVKPYITGVSVVWTLDDPARLKSLL